MILSKTQTVKDILERHHFSPNQALGQNFLIDEQVLEKIIKVSQINSNENIVEVGPGIGTLTQKLAEVSKSVVAVEKDKRLIPILKETLKDYDNVKIINNDILKTKIEEKSYKVISNIPYYITSPIIRKFLEEENKPSLLILTVQKEVAERVVAKKVKSNLLSVSVKIYAQPEIVGSISKNSFWPQPSISSAILKITPRSQKYSSPFLNYFFKIITTGFSHSRKQLKNNFQQLDKEGGKRVQLQARDVLSAMKELNICSHRRAETLSMEEWESLTSFIVNNYVKENKKKR